MVRKVQILAVHSVKRTRKSTLAMQLAKYVDPSLNLDRICFNANDFKKAILKAKKNQAIIYDEAFTGLSSRGALSEINKVLVSLMMEMRQRNLFVLVILPSIYYLEKYVTLSRGKGLIHTYYRGGKRGRFCVFNKKKLKLLCLKGRKDYSYSVVKSHYYGRFVAKYVIDEKQYRKKKMEALKSRDRSTKQDRFKLQRDKLIYFLHNNSNATIRETEATLKDAGVHLKKSVLGNIIADLGERAE